jgi:hypothetical protein
MVGIFDLFKQFGGLAGGGPSQFHGINGMRKQEEEIVNPPNLRHLLEGQVGGAGGSFIDMTRQARRTGEIPGHQMSMGMPGGNFNQSTPTPTPFPQEAGDAAGETRSLFPNFDADKFKKRLGHMGAGWAMGQNFDESMRLGDLAMRLGNRVPDDQMSGLLWLLRNR